MKTAKILACALFVVAHFQMFDLQELPSFRIMAPQTLCKQANLTNDDFIRISLQPKNGIKLNYKIKIFFKTMGNVPFTQRETLVIWKAVRTLEKRINVLERIKTAETNVIYINSTELIAGVNYEMHIQGITDAGEVTKEQIITLTYPSEVPNSKLLLNLELLGASVTVSLAEYTVHARIKFCLEGRAFNSTLQWRVENIKSDTNFLLDTNGKELTFPPFWFVPGNNYNIEAFVLEQNSSALLARNSLLVNVVVRGYEAYLLPSSTRIGLNTPIHFELFLVSFDQPSDQIKIVWEYFGRNVYNRHICNHMQRTRRCSIIFREIGRYKVMATIRGYNVVIKRVADVEVAPSVDQSFDFKHAPNLVQPSNEVFEFPIRLINANRECNISWLTIQEEGYKRLKPNHINSLLVETIFANETYEKDVILRIPPSNTASRLSALEGNSKYKFRMEQICPNAQNVSTLDLSFFEFTLHPNAPPSVGSIHINPLAGSALRTVFHVSLTQVRDLPIDRPLTFELCGIFDELRICYEKFMDYSIWEIQLPFTVSPVEFVVTVCDLRAACTVLHRNVTLDIAPADASEEAILHQFDLSNSLLHRMEFKSANNVMLLAGITYKNQNSTCLSRFKQFAKQFIRTSIKGMSANGRNNTSPSAIIEFVDQVQINLDLFQLHNTETDKILLNLLEQGNTCYNETNMNAIHLNRYRHFSNVNHSTSNAYVYASIYSKLLNSLFQSSSMRVIEENLLQRLRVLMMKMCQCNNRSRYAIETHLFSFIVEILPGSFLFNEVFAIKDMASNSYSRIRLLDNELDGLHDDEYYCITIVQYRKEDALLLDINVYNGRSGKFLNIIKDNFTTNRELEIVLQLDASNIGGGTCFAKNNGQWSSEQCRLKSLRSSIILCYCLTDSRLRFSVDNNKEKDNCTNMVDLAYTKPLTNTQIEDSGHHNHSPEAHGINSTSNQPTKSGVFNQRALLPVFVVPMTIIAGLGALYFLYMKKRKYKQDNNNFLLLSSRTRSPRIKYGKIQYRDQINEL